jgi:cell division protein FtsN
MYEQKTAALAKLDVPKSPVAEKSASGAALKQSVPAAGVENAAAVVKKPLVNEYTPVANQEQKQLVEAAGTPAGKWTVVVGSYLLDHALTADLAKIKKAGLTGLVQPGNKKITVMNRLLLAEYDNRGGAQAALDKLKRHTEDAFILDHGGTHAVYAGSYLLDSRAASEKERLGAAGFALTLKRAEVAIPSKSLSAGSFTDQKTAEAALNKLKAAGIKATLVRQ